MIDLSAFDHLPVGQTGAFLCPSCRGGQSRERSMTVHKDVLGGIKWYCFRASCGEKGQAYTRAGKQICEDLISAPEIRPYIGPTFELSILSREFFLDRYDLINPDIMESGQMVDRGSERYILPIRKPDGTIRGNISRKPWDGSPLEDNSDRPKSLTYWNEPGPLLAWYKPQNQSNEIYELVHEGYTLVVEDPLSAMRAAEHLKITTCAILGTNLSQEKVAELQKHTRHLYIALDADATGKAFQLARRWAAAFDSCKVIVLEQDIKDMPLDKLLALQL